MLDQAIVLWFPGPASATGDDVAELHLHGGRAVVAAVLGALEAIPGLCAAEPGAFTRRAFENGRIDLGEAEALGDLLRAETEMQRRSAMAQLEGGLSRLVGMWQTRLNHLSARVEAMIDHADEGDVAFEDATSIVEDACTLAQLITTALDQPPAERLHDGVRVVIAGAPNAGKSTLVNALAGRDVAIVTAIAGTTRDAIEVPLIIDGVPFLISDTAGIRDETDDAIEALGIGRARQLIDAADIVVALDNAIDAAPHVLQVAAKADLGVRDSVGLPVSGLTGEGLAALRRALVDRAADVLPLPGSVALNTRHRAALGEAVEVLAGVAELGDLLLVGEHIRLARVALDRVTGAGDTEAMLDALFSRFCIGK